MKNVYTLSLRVFTLFILFLLFSSTLLAQVGIGTTNPDSNAKLDITSTAEEPGGLLLPRVALTATNSPLPLTGSITPGMAVYNTVTAGSSPYQVTPGFYYNDGTFWVRLAAASAISDDWKLKGNSGTVAGTDFIGTTDNVGLQFKTNGLSRFEISTGTSQTLGGRLRAFTNGTVAEPTYSWSSNPGTGMFQQTAGNIIGFSTNGTERLRIPNANQVHAVTNGTVGLPFYSWADDTNMGMYRIGIDILGFSTNGAERMRIIANGDAGIGTNSPDARFHVSLNRNDTGALFSEISVRNSLWPGGEFYNRNTAGGSGVTGTGYYGVYGQVTTSAGWAGYFLGDVGATGNYYGSDERWKKNIAPLNAKNDMLKKVMLLNPKSYNWRAAEFPGMGFNPDRTSFGFIAQELKEIFPELVISKNIPDPKVKRGPLEEIKSVPGYYMVDYNGLIPILTEAIQEQQQIIISQEERISKLESLVQELLNKQ